MTVARMRHSTLIAAAAMISLAACAAVQADEAGLPRYVRAYVPVDGVEDWPRGGSVLQPISAREFEELADFLEPRKGVPDAQIDSAEFAAELSADEQLLTGTADLSISSRSAQSVFVPFRPCTLAVSDADWHEGGASRPALLGIDARGIQRLRVDQPGNLRFAWSLRGRRNLTGQIEFAAELPPALSSRVVLTLPGDWVPDVQAAIATPLDSPMPGTTRWQFDLGSRNQFRMRVLKRDAADAWRPLSLVRQTVTYEFLPQGVDVGAELQLVVPHDPLTQLTVAVDSPLEIIQANLGDAPVEFSESPTADGVRRVTFHFSQPIKGRERTLRLHAMAPLTTGGQWRLPRIRPEGPRWMGGKATLVIHKPLTLADLSVTQGRQSRVAALADPASDPEFELQLFASDAAIEVVLQRSSSKLDVAAATMIELTDTEINGRMIADIATDGSDRFVVGATLSRGWELVSEIESIPPGAIETEQTADPQRFMILVKRGIAADRPLRLRINARNTTLPADKKIEQEMFRMASFDDVGAFRNLIHVRARGPHQIEAQGVEHLELLRLIDLKPGDASRIEGGEPLLMWLDTPGQNWLRVAVREQSPHFTTHNSVEVRVTKDIVQRRYQIRCSPQASALNAVVVSFSGEDSPPSRWRVATHPEVRVTVEKWTPASDDDSIQPIGAAAWKLSLSQPLSQEFELTSDQMLPLGDSHFVNVIAVDGAEQQAGSVAIFCDDDAALVMENRGLKPIPAPPAPSDRNNALRGEFRYEPRDDVRAGRGVVLSVQRKNGSPTARKAFAWLATVESMVGTDGVVAHRATFFIENNGTRRLAVNVPGGKTPAIYVDGDEAATVAEPDGQRQYVELPAGSRFCTVTIDYQTDFSPSPWTVVRRISQPRPELEIPVLAWRGVVYTPPGYVGVNSLDAPLDGRFLSWRERLFGPLGRRPHEPVFYPFDWRTWNVVKPDDDSDREAGRQIAEPSLEKGSDGIASDPWGAVKPFGDLAASERGWTTTVHDFDDGAEHQVLLVRVTSLKTLQWTIFLAVFAGVCWRRPRRFAVRVVVLAVLGVLALFAPAVVAGVVTSALLGFAAALLACWTMTAVASLLDVGHQQTADAAAESDAKSIAAAVPEALAIFVAILVCVPAASTGQPPAPQSPIYRVFIPYADNPSNPVGDTYYISSEFDQALQRVRTLRREQQPGWLIRGASYQGNLVWEPGRARLVVERLRAVYDVEVSTSNVEVRFPFERARVVAADGGVSLDGSIIDPVWDADGTELSLPITDAGVYRLEIELRPDAEFAGATSRVEFSIPALCTSQLVLNLPTDAQGVEVPSAAGRVFRDSMHHQIVADLGATDRLTLTWPGERAPEQASLPVDVRQLARLTIQPSAVTLDARLKLKADRVRTITLEADPRLQLISQSFDAPDESTRIARVTATQGNPQIIEVEFEKTIYGEHHIDLSFFVDDTPGVGAVLFPRLNVAGVRSLRQFVAVSVDPGLQIDADQFTPNDALTPVSIDELGGQWDLPGLRTAQIYELARPDAEFTLPTTLHSPTTQGTEQLAFRRENGQINVSYQADLETRGGYIFQHRATVPSDFTADKVTILAEGESRTLESFQHNGNQLTVFLAAPLTGQHVLKIDGRRPQTDGAEVPAKIKLHGCDITESTLLPEFANSVDGDGPQQSLQVSGSLDKVLPKSLERQPGEPKVLLADVYIDWHQDGRYGGFVVFDVEPAGAQTVRLVLPEDDCQLIAARVAGLTAAARRLDVGQWDLPLSSAELPQRIEVIYQGRWTKKGRGLRQFQSPVLRFGDADLAVARTLWTVTAPAAAGRPTSASPSVRQVTLPEQQTERLGETESILSNGGPDLSLVRHFLGGTSLRSGAITRTATDGPREWLEIGYQPRGGGDGWQRLVVALIIMGGAVALLFAERHAAQLKAHVWLPPLACFLIGVLGWLFLWPGFLGLALMAAALVMALRLAWAG